MDYRPLGQTGMNVSCLGFGASSLGGVFHDVSLGDCVAAVDSALEGGINFFDVSPAYGGTLAELRLGRALEGVPRSGYFLATKIGSYSEARGDYDYSRASTERSVEHSLKRLGVDYLDLVQCHDVEFADIGQILDETLPTLHGLKATGVVRHVGITGLPLGVLRRIVERAPAGLVETVLSFCHYELNDTSLVGILPALESRGVGVINASPTGMGLLTPQGAPAWHPAGAAIRAGCARAVEFCKERGIDIVRLAIAFSCAEPRIASTLVSTTKASRVRDNISFASLPPDTDSLRAVMEILAPIRDANFTRGLPENHDPLLLP